MHSNIYIHTHIYLHTHYLKDFVVLTALLQTPTGLTSTYICIDVVKSACLIVGGDFIFQCLYRHLNIYSAFLLVSFGVKFFFIKLSISLQ